MKNPGVLLGLLVVMNSAVCFAADDFPAEVTNESALDFKETATSELPAGLQKKLAADSDGMFNGEGDKLAETLDVAAYDLNADGEMEYFVTVPVSYTGGAMMYLFGSEKSGFDALGAIQGIFYLAAPVNGYPQIVYTARAGGDTYERRLATFKDGSYQDTRAAEYTMNDNEDFVFVKDLPKPE